jgi:hypothetical protein
MLTWFRRGGTARSMPISCPSTGSVLAGSWMRTICSMVGWTSATPATSRSWPTSASGARLTVMKMSAKRPCA